MISRTYNDTLHFLHQDRGDEASSNCSFMFFFSLLFFWLIWFTIFNFAGINCTALSCVI